MLSELCRLVGNVKLVGVGDYTNFPVARLIVDGIVELDSVVYDGFPNRSIDRKWVSMDRCQDQTLVIDVSGEIKLRVSIWDDIHYGFGKNLILQGMFKILNFDWFAANYNDSIVAAWDDYLDRRIAREAELLRVRRRNLEATKVLSSGCYRRHNFSVPVESIVGDVMHVEDFMMDHWHDRDKFYWACFAVGKCTYMRTSKSIMDLPAVLDAQIVVRIE